MTTELQKFTRRKNFMIMRLKGAKATINTLSYRYGIYTVKCINEINELIRILKQQEEEK